MSELPTNSTVPTSRHKWWGTIVCTYAIYLLVYASLSLRTGLHWDEVLDFDGSAYDTYIAAGRWLTGVWRAFSGSWEPAWLPGFTSGLILCALVCAQAYMLGLRDAGKKWAFIILYFGSVQWASMLHYSFLVESIAVGMCCATAAARLSYKPGWKCATGAVLLLAVGIGAYQTLAMYFGVAWLLLRLLQLRRQPGEYSIMPWVRMACISGAGVAVWFCIYKLSLAFISQETLDYVQGYQSISTQWGRGVADHDISLQILCYLHYFKYTVMDALGVGRETYWLFATALLPLGGVIYHAIRHTTGWLRLEQCFIALLVWWLPFCMSILVLTRQSFRTSLAAPLAFAGLWMVCLAGARLHKRHTAILCLLGGGIIAAASITVWRESKREASLHNNSIALIAAMQERGSACAQAAGQPEAPIVVLADINKEATDFCGAYRMVAGTGCMNWYCRAYGIQNMRMGTVADKERHKACYEAMPSWPAEGCVRMDGDVVIIKATLDKK